MKNTVKKILLLLIVLLLSFPCFAETEEIVSNALMGQRIAQYNVELNAPFRKETSGIGS